MSLKNSYIESALNDSTLKLNLETFYHNYRESFEKAYAGLNFASLREEVGKIKVLLKEERMALFEQFKDNVEKTGGVVYEAKDSEDACRYISEICRKHNSEYVVKSKSMTAEEIGLNPYLESNGIKPIETDLGEWIIQLAKEKPSHMIMPAIHKNRQQVAQLFRNHLNIDIDENDIEGMVKIARRYLREFYFKAKVGISGANIAVAETGTIGIVTNEGNGRLVTTIPPVHIVVLGYEKLVRTFDEALKIMRVLPKNATGQIISVYVTWIKGAVDSIASPSSKKEIHYVFVDNGRKTLLGNEYFDEAMKCIRCGSCANVCPVYGVVGGHVFGHIYTGPIGAILTAFYHDDKKATDLLSLCSGCKACSEICPANIDLHGLICDLYSGLRLKYGTNKLRSFVYNDLLAKPMALKTTAKLGSFVSNKSLITTLVPKKHDFRELPVPSKVTFSEIYKKELEQKQLHVGFERRVLFYPGCAIEYLYPDVGIAAVRLLNRLSIGVDIPKMAVCCGFPAVHDGDGLSAKKIIKNSINYFPELDKYDRVLVLCPTCGSTLKSLFSKYLIDSPKDYIKARYISEKVVNLSKFLEDLKIKLKTKNAIRFTYHIPCHQNRGLHFSGEQFLKSILPKFYVPMQYPDRCCGFGGSFSVDYPNVSNAILDKKIEDILSTSAQVVVTECPGCIIQIRGGIRKRNIPIKVLHLSEFLDEYVVEL